MPVSASVYSFSYFSLLSSMMYSTKKTSENKEVPYSYRNVPFFNGSVKRNLKECSTFYIKKGTAGSCFSISGEG